MKEIKLEFIARLHQDGRILSDYIFRGQQVECINYWPSGEIIDHGVMTIDRFLEEATKIREKANA